MTEANRELDAVCGNCNSSFPAEAGGSIYAICLKDPEFEPYIDRLLANDFACCARLIKRKHFMVDRQACADFDPVEDDSESERFSELAADIQDLAAKGRFTVENLQVALAADAFRKTDWSKTPTDDYVQQLHKAPTVNTRMDALGGLGFLASQGNGAAFDALCAYLRDLPPPQTPDDCHFRTEILRHLRCRIERDREVAALLVQDLFRTPSNNHTRSWHVEVWKFFERCSPEVAAEALQPILDSPQFSYRIKRRVMSIIDFGKSDL